MKLVISLDVEEDGLFSGRYLREPPGVSNVAALERLAFIPREFGWPLTLLLSYQVAASDTARPIIEKWRDRYQAEIGAHLHHWNTPPFTAVEETAEVGSKHLSPAILLAKLKTLQQTIRDHFGCYPQVFRMGRFDWRPELLAQLPELGCRIDSSMVPLAHYSGQADQFLIPPDPFRLEMGRPDRSLVEVPVTMIAVVPGMAAAYWRLARQLRPAWRQGLLGRFRRWGAAGIHPTWFPLPSMRLAAGLHRGRGGQVLTMFLHAAELHPGATPFFPSEASVSRLVRKIKVFLTWLIQTGPIRGVPLSEAATGLHLPTLALRPDREPFVYQPQIPGAADGQGSS